MARRQRHRLAETAAARAVSVLACAGALAALSGSCSRREAATPPTPTPSATPEPAARVTPAPPDAEDAHRGPAIEQESEIAEVERTAIRRVIESQLDALARDDGATAFSFAAPPIQRMFGTPENFLHMVHVAYAPLVRPKSVRFAETSVIAGEVTQKVLVITSDGRLVVAMFLMDLQPAGEWKILGCVLGRGEETVA